MFNVPAARPPLARRRHAFAMIFACPSGPRSSHMHATQLYNNYARLASPSPPSPSPHNIMMWAGRAVRLRERADVREALP